MVFDLESVAAAAARPAMRQTARCRCAPFLALLLFLCGALPAGAQPQIMVAPTRITLDETQRSGEVFVINRGTEPVTARISVVNRHMREDGSFAPAVTPERGEHFADALLQYAPRRVHLAPGQGQTVRVLARLPLDAEPAEYRSHLLFRMEPPLPSTDGSRAARSGTGELGVRLLPVYGLTIPVILRVGSLSASAFIDGLGVSLEDGTPTATFELHRTGNRSIYGDVRVSFTPLGGRERRVGGAVGLAVYAPLPTRLVSVALAGLQGDDLAAGRLHVEFVDHDDGTKVLAEAERMLSGT